MNALQRLWLRLDWRPHATALESSADGDPFDRPEFTAAGQSQLKSSLGSHWFLNDIPFIAMLVMALAGVVLRLPVMYWVILMPIFGVISIAEGWSRFHRRSERVGMAYRVAAIWCAVLMSIYLLYGDSVQGVMNLNASSLAMLTLLALGTFVAGVQARVWQICGVGAVLFIAVPTVGWLDQSPLLLTVAAVAILAVGGALWWFKQMHSSAAESPLDDAAPRNS